MSRADYCVSKNANTSLPTFFAFSLSGISLLCGCFMLLLPSNETYDLLCLLPICYGFASFLAFMSIGQYLMKSMVSVLIFGGYFIRMVATPGLFAFGGYESFLGACVSEQGLTKAVVYMCLETITVLGVAAYAGRWVSKENEVEINFSNYNTKIFNIAVGAIFLFLFVAYIAIPAISSIYIFLPLADFDKIADLRWDNETIVERGTLARYVYSLFTFVWPIFRIIMPSFMITHFYKKYGTRTKGMICSIFCLILPAILLGGDNIAPFIGIFVGIIVLNKLYKKSVRKYLIGIGLVAVVPLGIVVLSKVSLMSDWRGATGISVVAQLLHNYFPGFDNMAVVFDMNQENKITTLFFDLYYAIPFKETLLGLKGEYIQDIFETYTATGGQIVPFMGQLTYYLGPFSLLFISLITLLSYKLEYKSRTAENFWKYFICMYLSINTAMALSIYSVSIYVRGLVNIVLPAYVIISLIGKKRGKQVGQK